jgi:hypothetical protein
MAIAIDSTSIGGSFAGGIDVDMPANGVVVIFVHSVGSGVSPTITGVTSSNLTWTRRATQTALSGSGTGYTQEEWWASSVSAFSAETVAISATSQLVAYYGSFSITGADLVAPFDVNGSLPAKNSFNSSVAPSLSVSTTSANTIILGALMAPSATGNPGSGFTAGPTDGSSFDTEYKIVSSTQSSLTVNWGSGETNAGSRMLMIADAIKEASAGASIPVFMFHYRQQGLA